MTARPLRRHRRWRVAVTRDEAVDGPLTRALEAAASPRALPGAGRGAAGRSAALGQRPRRSTATTGSSARARVRCGRWPQLGSRPWPAASANRGGWRPAPRGRCGRRRDPPPLAGDGAGADALWARLRTADAWTGRRVLVATTPGGRRALVEALTTAGADVDEVEAYRMEARPAAAIVATGPPLLPTRWSWPARAWPRCSSAALGVRRVRAPARRRRHRRDHGPGPHDRRSGARRRRRAPTSPLRHACWPPAAARRRDDRRFPRPRPTSWTAPSSSAARWASSRW